MQKHANPRLKKKIKKCYYYYLYIFNAYTFAIISA